MSGVLWAALAGLGFGLFQVLNARAMRGMGGVYGATFLQLLAAAAVLVLAALLTADPADLVGTAPLTVAIFAAAGIVHFSLGWTLLNLSQARIGAARTSPLLSTTPVWGLLLAVPASRQVPGVAALAGIVLMVAGAYLVTGGRGDGAVRPRDTVFGLGTACAWAVGAVLIVAGLDRFEEPALLGVAIGALAAALVYGIAIPFSGEGLRLPGRGSGWLGLKLAAGVVVGVATWARWLALDTAPVAVVLALNLLSVPVVLLLAGRLGKESDVVTGRVLAGAALVLAGALTLIALR